MIPPIYDMIYTALLSFAALSFAGPYLQLEAVTRLEYVLAFLYTAICVGFRHLETKFRLALSFSLLAAALVILWFNRSAKRFALLTKKQGYLWMFFLVLGCFFLQLLLERIPKLRLPAAIASLIFLLVNLFWGDEPAHFGVCMLFSWTLLLFCEITQQYWKKSGYTNTKQHMVYLSPFFLLGLVFLLSMPTSQEPYDWKVIKNIWNRIQERSSAFSQTLFHRQGGSYDISFLGFSDRGGLSDKITETDTPPIMEVTFSSELEGKLYLKGKVFDTFDGQNWKTENESTLHERTLDTLETYAAATACDFYHRTDYMVQENVKVRFLKFATQYLFVPPKAVVQNKIPDLGTVIQKGNDLLLDKTMGNQTEYNLSFFRLNKDNEVFLRLFENVNPCEPQLWQNTARSFSLPENQGYTYQDYQNYIQDIYRYDLAGISETELSERCRDFLRELLKNTDSDYERLCLLERFLGTLSYTLTPGTMPSRIKSPADFLDYFLFEKQSGYCSHYATAFVLFARALGIPSRYVQGFALVGTEDKTVTVSSQDAHAWAECYFPSVGWITFDPTPGSRVSSYWLTYEQRKELENDSYVKPELPEPEPEFPELLPLPEPEPEPQTKNTFPNCYIALAAGVCVLVLVLFLIADYLLLARHYKKATHREKWFIVYRKNLRLLKELGYRFTDGETLTEFFRRCALTLPSQNLQFLSCEERYLYAGASPDEEMVKTAEAANKGLLTELRKQNRLRYVFCIFMGLRV